MWRNLSESWPHPFHNELMLIREIMDYRPRVGGTILISHSQPDDWDSLMQTSTSYKVSMVKTLTEGATVVKLELGILIGWRFRLPPIISGE